MVKYYYENENFVIEDYDQAKTFSSFLPGVAGLHGIPIWSFYVNRGQGICSFGIQDKNNPILEFFPANTSYQYVHTYGFRTFIKCDGDLYEAFAPGRLSDNVKRYMTTNQSEFSIREINKTKGIEINVTYFGMPNENFGALVRKVQVTNLTSEPKNLEILDGLANILPFGVENSNYKNMSNLLTSWMDVEGYETGIPFYKLRASTGDEAEVGEIKRGHFSYSFINDYELLPTIIDASLVFGFDTTLTYPQRFAQLSVEELAKLEQVSANKVPCQFACSKVYLEGEQAIQLNTVIGHVEKIENIRSRVNELVTQDYINQRQLEAKEIIEELVGTIETKSGNSVFDAYAKQNYLDNLLRGGFPLVFGDEGKEKIYHVYSRKHGDLERDYNFFSLAPEFYSQGNGNFRDVNQNRRNDVLFNPKVGLYNVKTFMSLMQLDGYNPLGVLGSTFTLETESSALIDKHFASHHEVLEELFKSSFTPGKIVSLVEREYIKVKTSETEFLNDLLAHSSQNIEADFGEGYWSDHWTYNLDLIQNYLLVHPETLEHFIFEDRTYRYYDSPVRVMPRHEKYVLNTKNKVRQYGAIMEDHEKVERLNINPSISNWVKSAKGQGDIYETHLFEKIVSLALNKFSNLDPEGLGLEMEANKPGWNDAMNGLPGVFGSGLSESVELIRLLEFTKDVIEKYVTKELPFTKELITYMTQVEEVLTLNLNGELTQFDYWNRISDCKEAYREEIRFGISGEQLNVRISELGMIVNSMLAKLYAGIDRAKKIGNGLLPTYLTYEATDYELITDEEGEIVLTHYGLPAVTINSFKLSRLPYFLEAPARALKICRTKEEKEQIYRLLKETDIYDDKLHMYKTSESLDEITNEIGRCRAFTPGWLERESIFLHMTYKYLLGLLKSGLYDEFYEEIKTNFVCFQDPMVYGRSTLENSSFIASSVNPNEKLHGQGFVARLSGSTSEFLSMWNYMMVGKEWFSYQGKDLVLTFKPILPGWMFDETNSVSFKFLGYTMVTYHNPSRFNTYAPLASINEIVINGISYQGGQLIGSIAEQVRNHEIDQIDIYFNK